MDKDRVEETARHETEGKGGHSNREVRRIEQAKARLSRHVQQVMPVQRRSPASVRQSRKAP